MHTLQRLFILLFLLTSACEETKEKSAPTSRFLKAHDHHSESMQAKVRAYYGLELQSLKKESGTWHIQAKVRPQQDLGPVHIEWKWPEDAEVVEGGNLNRDDLEVGQSYTFDLRLQKKDFAEGDQVFFFVYALKGEKRLGATKSLVFGQDGATSKNEKKKMKLQKENSSRFLQ